MGYSYDLAGNIVARTEAGDTVEFVYDSLTGLPRAVSASDGSWWVYADGLPLAQHTSTGSTAYLHTDIRGDVRVATDATGAVTDTWTYTVDGQLTARTGTTPVSVGGRGETHDTTTGLIWLRARWYDPATARFLSADPWHGNPANPISLNRYVYANADPVNMHDPTGLFSLTETATVMRTGSEQLARWVGMVLPRAISLVRTAGQFYWRQKYWFLPLEAYGVLDEAGLTPGLHESDCPGDELHDRDSADPALQPQADGAGAGLPPQCPAGRWPMTQEDWDDLRDLEQATREDAFRKAGVPAGVTPTDTVVASSGAVVQYVFEVDGSTILVTFQGEDRNHGPHWEWGAPSDTLKVNRYDVYQHSNLPGQKGKWDLC